MNREQCLDGAKACVLKDRDDQYGAPEDSFECIAGLWQMYLWGKGKSPQGITPADVAAMLALLKIARIARSPTKADNWVDLAGYAACGAECATGGG